jgi:hypothetical protein
MGAAIADRDFDAALAGFPLFDQEAGKRFVRAAEVEHTATQVQVGAESGDGGPAQFNDNPAHQRDRDEGSDSK